MATPIVDPPDVHELPVSWHADSVFDFENNDPDDAALNPPVWTPIDYEDGVSLFLDVKTTPPQRFEAEIDGVHAVVRIESEIADTLKTGTLWVLLQSHPGAPSTELPIVNGEIKRYDGKST